MSKHTPGPWVHDVDLSCDGTVFIQDAKGQEGSAVAEIFNNPARDANARLIAKTPELLAALRNLLAVESKSWPSYIRTEFATARKLLAEIDGDADSQG